MKHITFIFLFIATTVFSQEKRNIIVITIDGMRWQEVFGGVDSILASDPKFNQDDSAYIFNKYWAPTAEERRKKLMPFLWSVVEENGQIYGNRAHENFVNITNPYRLSFPGYSEMLTGFVDLSINSNSYPDNENENVFAFLNKQRGLKGKVAAFGAWFAFDRILNEKKSGFPVVNAFDKIGGDKPNEREKVLNSLLNDSSRPWGEEECLDVFTHYASLEWLRSRKPHVMYIAYGETDEWAHSGFYRWYLDAALQTDKFIRDIWNYVQSDSRYRNKTTLIITTDHGRGDNNKADWVRHGKDVEGADETWFAVIGPFTKAKGEVKEKMQIHTQQFAQTIAKLMNHDFQTSHPVAPYIEPVFE